MRKINVLLAAVSLTAASLHGGILQTSAPQGPASNPRLRAPLAVVLYDQTSSPSGSNITDQDFETAFDVYDNEGADDFVVTWPGGWSVTQVAVLGVQGPGPALWVNVNFYPNNVSLPGAAPVCSYPGITGANLIQAGGNLTATLPTPCSLPAGTYWMAFQVRQDFATAGQYYWNTRSIQTNSQAVWRNPGDGFGTGCLTFGPIGTCLPGSGSDFLFRIVGDLAGGGGGGGQGNLAASVVVSSSKNPSTVGNAVTFTANVVTNTPQFTPSGSVQFRDGGTVLGNGTLNLLGQASFATSALTVGTHSISAYFSGDVNYAPALSAILTQTVGALPTSTTTTLTSSANPSLVAQSVTLTATVAPSAATGTVTFMDGATSLGTGTLASGVATLSTSALAAGLHSLTAVYGGSGSYQTSTSAVLTQTVNKIATTTALTLSKSPAKLGESVTFTATVAPSAATGTITFQDGLTALGTVSLSGGSATLTTSSLAVGVHTITATYGGDSTYLTSFTGSTSLNVLNAQGCTSGGTETLCVQNTRFKVSVAWTNQYAGNQTGVGTAYQLTTDAGDFTFFSANNIELVVKVLDGTAVNGMFWVGYASLTDVGFTLTVEDTKNSVTKTYTNAPGTLASATDVTAFAARPEDGALTIDVTGEEYGQLASLQAEAYRQEAKEQPAQRAELADAGACTTSGGNLCLNGGRFQLSLSWTNYNDNSTGTGTALALTADSGYFWFFNPPNVELMCKVLDGTSVNGKFWLLYGSLTDVQFTLTATDTNTSTSKTYTNPARTQGSKIDINAF